MSLWSVPVEDITYEMLDDFLTAKVPEGVRLDYKNQIGDNLDKVIAAFANTLGGIIILGVDENKQTNEPVWPPSERRQEHLQSGEAVKLRDQLFSLAHEKVYPPVSIQVGRVIPNKQADGKVLVVIRVDESKDAPHTVEKKQQVYIVEKTDNVSDRFTLADIDRIERMLERRRRSVEQREDMIQDAVKRCRRLLDERSDGYRLRWFSFVPYFPWRPICDKDKSHQTHRAKLIIGNGFCTYQRVPGGSVGLRYTDRFRDQKTFRTRSDVSEVNVSGHLFMMQPLAEVDEQCYIRALDTLRFIKRGCDFLKRWYDEAAFERPSLCQVSLGFIHADGLKMIFPNADGGDSIQPALNADFHVSRTVQCDTFVKDPVPDVAELMNDLFFCFDADPVSDLVSLLRKGYF